MVERDMPESTEPRSGRQRILERARDLFLERGFQDVSMREIADAAGLRKASIYHHFADKEELFTAIILQETRDLRECMAASIEGVSGFRERLTCLTRAHIHSTRSHSVRLVEDFRTHIPESRHDDMHDELRNLFAVYEQVFSEAHAAGEIVNIEPSLAASCFFQIVLSFSWDWLETGGAVKPPPDDLADLAIRIVLHGIASPSLR
ncbi:MAG: TetR/AcrR family transcriptional regulator [Chloroflexota bacterium]|jgi:AcrR family transcriptional regulator|nr:TetR/AcrR family transcriptional regulator [Chloroflexota bacterium]